MEMDVNLARSHSIELKTISAGSYSNKNAYSQHNQQSNNNNNNSNNNNMTTPSQQQQTTTNTPRRRAGCCGILSRLLCASGSRAKTASSSNDYNNFDFNLTNTTPAVGSATTTTTAIATTTATTTQPTSQTPLKNSGAYVINPIYNFSPQLNHKQHHHQHLQLHPHQQQHQHHQQQQQKRKTPNRRTPQEIYLESRGKSCKKLLKFNGNSNKILLYPEEGWARTASSSYWTITPCWWQPNRCRIEEFAGTQRHTTKAKMVSLEQKGSLLIAGHFRSKNNNIAKSTSNSTRNRDNNADEFKLHLSSNITMEDYNMGYCLTGFVERRCQQTNTFQMTHFAVIKRQWPSITSNTKST